MSGATEHAFVLSIERIDVPRASEVFGASIRVGKRTNGSSTVVSRYAGRTTLEFVDGNGKRRAEHRRIVDNLHVELQLAATLQGYRRTKHATRMLEHKVYLLRCYFFGGDNKVAFVFAVFVVDHNNKFSFTEIGNSLFYTI